MGPPADSARVVPLPALQVTVTRQLQPLRQVARAVSAVSAPDIQDARATLGLDESLALVPGVLAANRYNVSLGTRIAIRGFGSRAAFGVRGVRILVDGIPLTNADGQAKLTNLDLGSAGRIEVIRGPASTLYGNAAGGVISVRTEAPPPVPLAGEARLIVGDEGDGTSLGNLTKWQVKAGGQAGRAEYLGSYARTDAAGFRENSRARTEVFNGSVALAPDTSSTLRLLLNVASQPLAQNPGSLPLDSARLRPRAAWPANTAAGAAEDASQAQAGLAYDRRLGPSRIELLAYGANRTVDNPLTFSIVDLNRHAGGVRSTISLDGALAGRAASLVAGMDLEAQRDARHEFVNAGGARRGATTRDQIDRVSAFGPFAEAQLALAPRLRLGAGVRYDDVRFATDDRYLADGDNSGQRALAAVSPRASLLFNAGDAASFYASLATSFQTPTTTELINAPPAPGQPCCAGGFNTDLRPEHALSYEIGARGWLAPRLRYDLALYTMGVRDEIVSYRVPQVPDRDFYRNAGRSRHQGVELGLEALVTPFLQLAGAYTVSRFTFIDDGLPGHAYEGNRLPGIPPQQLVGRLTLRAAGLDAQAEAQHVARFFVDDANTASNPAYTVVELRLQARRRLQGLGLAPFAALGNAFDARYNASVVINAVGGRYYEPAPGRHLLLGLDVPIGDWRH